MGFLLFLFLLSSNVPRAIVIFTGSRQFELNTIDAVDAVDEENKNEDECDFQTVLQLGYEGIFRDETVGRIMLGIRVTGLQAKACARQYLGTYVNILLRMANGRGIIRSMKRAISATRSRKTWKPGIVSQAGGQCIFAIEDEEHHRTNV